MTGIDVGTRSLKGIQLARHKGRVCVEKFFYQDLAANNELYPLDTSAGDTLKALATVSGFQKTPICCAPADGDVLTLDLTLPEMPKKDLESAVRNEIETHLNLKSEDVSVSYLHLKPVPVGDATHNLIKVYCVNRQVLLPLLQSLRAAGTEPKHVDSGILARIALLIFNGTIAPDKNYIQIDIGESHIAVALVHNSKVSISSVLPRGMGAINKLLFDSSGLVYNDAEKIKLSYDLGGESSSIGEIEQNLIDENFQQIFYKVRRLVDVFRVHLKSDPIESVILTGGGSQLKHLPQTIEESFKLPSVIADPFKNIDLYSHSGLQNDSLARLAPYMATAVGLALRGVG